MESKERSFHSGPNPTVIPVAISMGLLFTESLRVLPGEIRIVRRIWNRRRINIGEALFFLIKYLALLGTIAIAVVYFTSGWLAPEGCLALSWISFVCLLLDATLISGVIALRCYVILKRKHRVAPFLLLGLSLELVLAMWSAATQPKYRELDNGVCRTSDEELTRLLSEPWFHRKTGWCYLYNFLFDCTVMLLASWNLIKGAREFGFFRNSKLLFVNNLHYLCIVSWTYLVQFFVDVFLYTTYGTLIWLTMILQVMVALQLLISEQDDGHGYTRASIPASAPASHRSDQAQTAGLRPPQDEERLRGFRSTSSVLPSDDPPYNRAANGVIDRSARRSHLDSIRYDLNEEDLVEFDMCKSESRRYLGRQLADGPDVRASGTVRIALPDPEKVYDSDLSQVGSAVTVPSIPSMTSLRNSASATDVCTPGLSAAPRLSSTSIRVIRARVESSDSTVHQTPTQPNGVGSSSLLQALSGPDAEKEEDLEGDGAVSTAMRS